MSDFFTLTKTGKALCVSLGLINPTNDACWRKVTEGVHICNGCIISSPDERAQQWFNDPRCIPMSEYTIFDGSHGTEFYCSDPKPTS